MNNIRLKTPVLLIIIIITIITHTCQCSNNTINVVQMFTSTDVHKVFSQSFNICGEKHLITQIYLHRFEGVDAFHWELQRLLQRFCGLILLKPILIFG